MFIQFRLIFFSFVRIVGSPSFQLFQHCSDERRLMMWKEGGKEKINKEKNFAIIIVHLRDEEYSVGSRNAPQSLSIRAEREATKWNARKLSSAIRMLN